MVLGRQHVLRVGCRYLKVVAGDSAGSEEQLIRLGGCRRCETDPVTAVHDCPKRNGIQLERRRGVVEPAERHTAGVDLAVRLACGADAPNLLELLDRGDAALRRDRAGRKHPDLSQLVIDLNEVGSEILAAFAYGCADIDGHKVPPMSWFGSVECVIGQIARPSALSVLTPARLSARTKFRLISGHPDCVVWPSLALRVGSVKPILAV